MGRYSKPSDETRKEWRIERKKKVTKEPYRIWLQLKHMERRKSKQQR